LGDPDADPPSALFVATSLTSIRIALIQARSSADMILQEQECFLERLRLEHDQLLGIDITASSVNESIFSDIDAMFIGGAGEYSAIDDYPWIDDAMTLVRQAADRSFPLFGSCWGHQIIARALGGTVVYDPDRSEMGCHSVELTQAGVRDRLFRDFPTTFLANMGHHDRVSQLPVDAIELARNESQPFQSFRISGKPIYGTQFHSELDAHRERERLIRYRQFYLDALPDEDEFRSVMTNLAETTEVDHLMHDFLSKYVLRSNT